MRFILLLTLTCIGAYGDELMVTDRGYCQSKSLSLFEPVADMAVLDPILNIIPTMRFGILLLLTCIGAYGDELMVTDMGYCQSKSLSTSEPVADIAVLDPIINIIPNITIRENARREAVQTFHDISEEFVQRAISTLCPPTLNHHRHNRGIIGSASLGTKLLKLFKYSKVGTRVSSTTSSSSIVSRLGKLSKWDIAFTVFGVAVSVHQEFEINSLKNQQNLLLTKSTDTSNQVQKMQAQQSTLSSVVLQQISSQKLEMFFTSLRQKLAEIVSNARPHPAALKAEIHCNSTMIQILECFSMNPAVQQQKFKGLKITHVTQQQLDDLMTVSEPPQQPLKQLHFLQPPLHI